MDASMDFDHNRAVVAFFGSADDVQRAALSAAAVAVAEIDLRQHSGVHPRAGAIDVVPIIPLAGAQISQAVDLSRAIGQRLADELCLPVFLYESSASREERMTLARVRSSVRRSPGSTLTGNDAPDFGPPSLHPTAGAVAVGARGPLVAYNVNMPGSDPRPAGRIAAAIRREREAGRGMAGVRALGLALASRGMTQVSTNVTLPDACPVRDVFDFVEARACEEGIEDIESELIGVVSRAHLTADDQQRLRFSNLRETQFIEHWLP